MMAQQFSRWGAVLFFFILFPFTPLRAQQHSDSLSIQLYADVYHSWIPEAYSLKNRPAFIYNYSQLNRPSLNMGMVRLNYSAMRFRSTVALIAGTYPRRNLAQEARWARNIGECSIGYRLTRKQQLWLDAGVFPSHIGAESYVGKENLAATRALVSDQTPYYETGIRVQYQPTEQWLLSMLALNGWQRITAPINQLGANWGLQVQYKPNDRVLFNNSSFIGQVQESNNYKTRIYSNTYASFSIGKQDILQVGWDIGFQDRSDVKGVLAWNTFLTQYQHVFNGKKWAVLARFEKMADPHHVLYSDPEGDAFSLYHASANVDWRPDRRLLFRLEWNHQFGNQFLFSVNSREARRLSGIYLIASVDLHHAFF